MTQEKLNQGLLTAIESTDPYNLMTFDEINNALNKTKTLKIIRIGKEILQETLKPDANAEDSDGKTAFKKFLEKFSSNAKSIIGKDIFEINYYDNDCFYNCMDNFLKLGADPNIFFTSKIEEYKTEIFKHILSYAQNNKKTIKWPKGYLNTLEYEELKMALEHVVWQVEEDKEFKDNQLRQKISVAKQPFMANV